MNLWEGFLWNFPGYFVDIWDSESVFIVLNQKILVPNEVESILMLFYMFF